MKGAELTRLRPRAAKSFSGRDAPGAWGCCSRRVAHSWLQAATAPPPPPHHSRPIGAGLTPRSNQWHSRALSSRGVPPVRPSCLWALPGSGAWVLVLRRKGAGRPAGSRGKRLRARTSSLVRSSPLSAAPPPTLGSRLELRFRRVGAGGLAQHEECVSGLSPGRWEEAAFPAAVAVQGG